MLRCSLSYAKIMLISQSDAFYIDSNFFFVFSKDALLAYSLIIDCPSLLSFVLLIDHIEEFNPEFQWIKLLACDISKYFHSNFFNV